METRYTEVEGKVQILYLKMLYSKTKFIQHFKVKIFNLLARIHNFDMTIRNGNKKNRNCNEELNIL